MANNNSMVKAKKEKNNEFYTEYSDIQDEINAFLEYDENVFKDKTVLLPCDDPEWSNFTKFFAKNFTKLGLKKLISTSFSIKSKNEMYGYQLCIDDYLTDFEKTAPQYDESKTSAKGKIFVLTRRNKKQLDVDDLEWKYLEGDGDFRSDEIKKLRDESDIIVTNPPFALLTDFFSWIFETNKQFIIIGNIGASTYKDVFPLIQNGKMWLGKGFNGGNAYFRIPQNSNTDYADGVYDAKTGKVKFRNCCWYTNIEHGRRHQPLPLMSMHDNLKFSKHKDLKDSGYVKYDNYDAIEVNYSDAIPSDYKGIMGVASSFLEKFCPEQFEIVAATQTGCHPDSMVLKKYKDYKGYYADGRSNGRNGSTCGNNPMLSKNDGKHAYYMNDEGHIVQSANGRILIRYTKEWINNHPEDFKEN